MGVPRGTTPAFVLTFSENSGVDLTQARNVYVTFRSGSYLLTKTGTDLDIEPRSVSAYLSQEETLRFQPGIVEIQANWTTETGGRAASEITEYRITKQLLESVIE